MIKFWSKLIIIAILTGLTIGIFIVILERTSMAGEYYCKEEEEEPVTHGVCRDYACVQVEGDEESTCNSDEDCQPVIEEEEQESTPSSKPKTHKNSEDKRCHATTPPQATWIDIKDGSITNNWHPLLTWSAIGGDKVEVKFSENPNDLRWRFITLNDGHDVLGYKENTGTLGMVWYYYQMRTINECKTGPWSPVLKAFN